MEYKTSVFYAGGGSTYTFPFEYLQKSFVKVRYQKPDGSFQNLEFGKDYTVEENRVNLTTASDSTYKVNIYRSTPTDRMVKYVDASILKAHDMNVNELQTLHIMEEQTDYLTAYALFRGDNANVWEANTLRIINLATPLEPTDAVNKAYVDEYGVTWNQNVAQMKKQLQDQNTNITNQLDTQNRNITKQLADQQTLFNQQLSDQDASFNGRIAEHDTELLNKVNTNNQKYKTELQTYNDGVVQQIHDDAGASAALAKKWAQDAGSPDNESDSVSPTGKTQSAKSWAEVAKSQAQASSTSAAEAKKSQSAASASEQNAESFMEDARTYANAALRSQEASASSESKAKASEVNAKASERAAAESANQAAAGQINADWNVTDTTSKAFVKNKPGNLINIGNNQIFDLETLYKDDNFGNPVYFLMHELVQYNPDTVMLPISSTYGFNGMVFSEPRVGNGNNQLLAFATINLGYENKFLYSSSSHYSPVVLKDETNSKYYWAMKVNGSGQRIYMLGAFTDAPLKTTILALNMEGALPDGWSLVHTALSYPFDNTHVASADKDGQGNKIDTTYAKKEDAGVLSGTVMAFSGTFENGYPLNKRTGLADKKWHLCDGTNGTPDLRQRFILGGDGSDSGTTGGEASVTLTEQTIPEHSHSGSAEVAGDHTHKITTFFDSENDHFNEVSCSYTNYRKGTATIQPSGNHTHNITIGNTGGGQPHNNMPPYYVLAYIMKL